MLLAWQNNWDGATLAASSALGTLPVTNTQVAHLSQKWQTAAAVKSAFVTADMGTDETKWKQSVLAVLGSNLSKNAAFRLRGSASDPNAVTDVVYDSRPLPATRGKALRMVRTSGSFASTPNAPANRLTGAFDIRVRLIVDPALPDTECYLMSKGAVNWSWIFGFAASGTIFIYLSTDGVTWANAGGAYGSTATFANLFDGTPRWLRVTRSAAGQIIFYTSDDGQTWAQLGAAVAGTATALFDTTDSVRLHSFESALTGYVLYAEMRNGIAGPVVSKFDPDMDAAVGATSFTSSDTREVWSLTQVAAPVCAIVNLDGGNLRDGDGRIVRSLSLSYLKVPGLGSNFAETPDSAAISVTGDIDIRLKVSCDDWTPTLDFDFLDKIVNDGSQFSYLFRLNAGGTLQLYWSQDGSTLKNAISTVATGFADGSTHWVRATLDVNNGAAGNTATFYTSEDGINWSALGAAVTAAGVTSIFDGTATLQIAGGRSGVAGFHAGRVYYAEIRNTLAAFGTAVVASFDPSRAAATGATSFTAETGEVWTINQAGSPKAELVRESFVKARYWRLDLTDYSVASSLQAGRVFLGPSWAHQQALVYPWGATPIDQSVVTKSRGGQSFPDALPKYRALDCTLDFLKESEIYENPFAMARANGAVKDVLAIPFESGSYISEQAVWGLVKSVQEPVVHRLTNCFRQKFRIEERL